MSIDTINITGYRRQFGEDDSQHRGYQNRLPSIIREALKSASLEEVSVYNLEGDIADFAAGRQGRRLVIYNNSRVRGMEQKTSEEGFIMNGIKTNYKARYTTTLVSPENITISSEEGILLAVFDPESEQLYIPFDLLGQPYSLTKDLFRYIMEQLNTRVYVEREKATSWEHGNREALSNTVKNIIVQDRSDEIERKKGDVRDIEFTIADRIRSLSQYYRRAETLRLDIQRYEDTAGDGGNKVINDLDTIVANSKIADVRIKQDMFNIVTKDLITYDESGQGYMLGSISMTIDMQNSRIRFANPGNARRGYWTEHDPHPHVDGGNGNACWGSTAPIIAELSAQGELYALVLSAIDFLESVNTDDPAGRNVVSWDKCDENGQIIAYGYELGNDEDDDESRYCECCGEHHHEDTFSTVYNHATVAEGVGDDDFVCEECLTNHYRYSDYYDEYVHADIDEPEEDE